MARKTKGRQKVEMTKMTKESNLQVTFSKRRAGLFKKASELCTLTGAEVAILVFSPGKKAFSFGHPCVETIVDRFLAPNNASQTSSPMREFIEARRNENVRELNVQLTEVLGELEMEKKRGDELRKMSKANRAQNWWEAPIEELTLPQLEQLRASLEELKKNISNYLLLQAPNLPPPPHYASSSTGGGVVAPPFNLNFPYMEPKFNGGFNPDGTPLGPGYDHDTGFSRGYY